jgi:hypothetical protein
VIPRHVFAAASVGLLWILLLLWIADNGTNRSDISPPSNVITVCVPSEESK